MVQSLADAENTADAGAGANADHARGSAGVGKMAERRGGLARAGVDDDDAALDPFADDMEAAAAAWDEAHDAASLDDPAAFARAMAALGLANGSPMADDGAHDESPGL